MHIDVGTLRITNRHISKVMKALKSNRLSYGPMTDEFEKRFAKKHGNTYGVFTNSGTSALQASIHALKILNNWKDGDEIILPATTFVASYNVILQNKMKPVMVDIAEDFNIDPDLIEKKITKRTRAIMPVHLLGKPCQMEKILKIAKKYKLKIIEDSCETMGVSGVGIGDVTCFSFYVAHLLITGVGGMAITKDKELASLIRSLIFHGRDTKYLQIDDDNKYDEEVIHARFKFNYPGYSSRGTEIEAALGLVELDLLDRNIKKRQENARYINSKLRRNWSERYLKGHAFMMFPYLSENRNTLMLKMEKNGITTRTIMPLINQPYIKVKGNYPVSQYVLRTGFLFGCHQNLTKKELDFIVKIINYEKT